MSSHGLLRKLRGMLQNLSSRKNERIDIQPGMTATAEIKTGRQTVLRYLTKPITKTLDEALRER